MMRLSLYIGNCASLKAVIRFFIWCWDSSTFLTTLKKMLRYSYELALVEKDPAQTLMVGNPSSKSRKKCICSLSSGKTKPYPTGGSTDMFKESKWDVWYLTSGLEMRVWILMAEACNEAPHQCDLYRTLNLAACWGNIINKSSSRNCWFAPHRNWFSAPPWTDIVV